MYQSFNFKCPATTVFYTLSLHDALPIYSRLLPKPEQLNESAARTAQAWAGKSALPSSLRSEEHTSELQSRENLVCRLLLEKKKRISQKFTQVHAFMCKCMQESSHRDRDY